MEIQNEYIFLAIHLGLISIVTGISIILNKPKSYLVCHLIAFLYIGIRMLYIYDYYPIYRYEDINNDNKYYGIFSNALVIDDPQAFYINYMFIYASSALIENINGKKILIIIWFVINIISPLTIWLYHHEIYQHYNVYVTAFEHGLISTTTCFMMFIIVSSIVNDEAIKDNDNITKLYFYGILFVLWFLLNMMNIELYDNIYNSFNVNLGYLTAFMFV